jgi:hypothetical protein
LVNESIFISSTTMKEGHRRLRANAYFDFCPRINEHREVIPESRLSVVQKVERLNVFARLLLGSVRRFLFNLQPNVTLRMHEWIAIGIRLLCTILEFK